MTTRNQANRHRQSTDEDNVIRDSVNVTKPNGNLANKSKNDVMKFLNRITSRGSRKLRNQYELTSNSDSLKGKGKEKQVKVDGDKQSTVKVEDSSEHARVDNSSPMNVDDEIGDSDWEDGSNPNLSSQNDEQDHINRDITIEFDSSPGTSKRKPVRRASAEEKEAAELVHRVHLLCLLGRGRLIDTVCDDPLIQASLMSLLPANLIKLSEVTNPTVAYLTRLVSWLHKNFHVRSSSSDESFHSALGKTLQTQEGTPEEVAALSVALFRALNFSTRFVSILDVASLKPEADKSEDIFQGRKAGKGIFDSSTVMVNQLDEASTSSGKQSAPDVDKKNRHEAPAKPSRKRKVKNSSQTMNKDQSNEKKVDVLSEGSKRKSDIEFELQMEMALAATAAGTSESNVDTDIKVSNITSPFKKLKKVVSDESSGVSTAVGSKKIGAPMYWAEVFCSGVNSTGKWVHVDAVNAVVDGEQHVEPSTAACKTSLRYVVAFAGRGAKDVTRRYCAKWYKIASRRVDQTWWDAVLLPLKGLESKAIAGTSSLPNKSSSSVTIENNGQTEERTYIEDMELETKALTEPLPTSQQAYRSHHLYALERWLTKYQVLHPKGPVLGFCAGRPVYPRACVQMLHTKERWLREGLQLKPNELPVKVMKRSVKSIKRKAFEPNEDDENDCVGPGNTIDLYGKWQTEPLCLPPAENGIVPKNERGQVDVWSEKCLPPGTVHLGFHKIFLIAKKLKIDFAPAMVGFDFRNGRSVPVYNGIVVCSEFKDTILEAYAEEEERRGAEERRKNEAKAMSRWYQLLSSIVTRQRLNNRYVEANDKLHNNASTSNEDIQKPTSHKGNENGSKQDDVLKRFEEDHEHVFTTGDASSDVESSVRTKRCHCGFSIEVEEL